MVKKKKPIKKKLSASTSLDALMVKMHIEDKGDLDYYKYALEVIEDRAIFGEIDGLKPVTRRALWAAYQLNLSNKAAHVKAARVVGDTMGKYHPHGDSSIYSAMVTAANTVIPMLDGDGNWGTMTDPAAASRYTNVRLSLFSDLVFFDDFYMPVIDMMKTYDETMEEPLILPSLLPNALINGNFGIAPGVQASSPIVTFPTLAKALLTSIKAGESSVKACRNIELTTTYGGVMLQTDDIKATMKSFLETGRGRFVFDIDYTEEGNEIRITGFPFSSFGGNDSTDQKKKKANRLEQAENVKGVVNVRDDSSKTDRNVSYVVTFAKSLSATEQKIAINEVLDVFSEAVTYNMQATERKLVEKEPVKKLRPTNVPDLLTRWINYRVDLEKDACKYWIGKRQTEIARFELMILAVLNREFIIQALGKKLDDSKLAEYIAKGLKITVEQANEILDLKIRQLKSLDHEMLKKRIADRKAEIKGYKGRISDPLTYIHGHVTELARKISNAYPAK